jgi:hypothetical protein
VVSVKSLLEVPWEFVKNSWKMCCNFISQSNEAIHRSRTVNLVWKKIGYSPFKVISEILKLTPVPTENRSL